MRFSASRLTTWMHCPLQAKFKYIDRLPEQQNAKASFGTCIHHALEQYNHTADLELAKATFRDVWEHPEKLGVAPDYWPKFTTYSSLLSRGLQILDEYHEKQKWDSRDVLATEHRFLVPMGEHEITGVVDLLEIRKSGRGKDLLRIVDYKSSSRKPTLAELALNVQFSMYDYASREPEFWVGNGPDFPGIPNGEWMYETLADLPRRNIWYHLWGNAEIDAGSREPEDFMRMYRAFQQIERAIDNEVFVPDISGASCTVCAYAGDPCPVVIPDRQAVLEEEAAWL